MTDTTNPTPTTTAPEGGAPDEAAIAAAAAAEAAKTPDAPLEVEADEPDAKGVVQYNPTGDVGLDMALEFVGEHGYGPDHPAMQAAINGNFDLLEAELAKKDIKGYAAYIKLAQKAYGDISAKTKEKQKADQAAVETTVGGAEQWEAIKTWAGENASDTEKAEVQGMLSKGGLSAQMAAAWLNQAYTNATGKADTEGSGPSVSEVRGTPPATQGALSPDEYGAAVVKARQAHTSQREPFEQSKAYKDLRDRRARYKA